MDALRIPEIPDEQRTPLVELLLAIVQQQAERIGALEDEIARLKGLKARPAIKPSILEHPDPFGATPKAPEGKRPGSEKRHKTEALTIHETVPRRPEGLPDDPLGAGYRFKGYEDFVVQDLVLRPSNALYRLERWEAPDGTTLTAAPPEELRGGHFGPGLMSFVLYQYHQQHVTQPLIREALLDWGVDISAGQVNRIITEGHDALHEEALEVLRVGLELSRVLHVDDTQARHRGKNGHCTLIGGELFSSFASTGSKSRANLLNLLRAGHDDCVLNEAAWAYLEASHEAGGIPDAARGTLAALRDVRYESAAAFAEALRSAGITAKHQIKIATEAALLGSAVDHGLPADVVLISDGAPQFRLFVHALCWMHAERPFARRVPRDEGHGAALKSIRHSIWELYRALKAYRGAPDPATADRLRDRFRELVGRRTGYPDLDKALVELGRDESSLLRVLERPEAPLHNNAGERAIRDVAKKRKISGSTRGELGRRCRDTFATLKGTCRKLGQSFWRYLCDRVGGGDAVAPLSELMRGKATAPS